MRHEPRALRDVANVAIDYLVTSCHLYDVINVLCALVPQIALEGPEGWTDRRIVVGVAHQHHVGIAQPEFVAAVGVCLSDDKDRNEIELTNGIEIARNGDADILAVGNEVLLRDELSERELIDYIDRAKQAAPAVSVSYVDAYFQFEDHPALTKACDVVLINCYPFWEECHADYALLYMKDMYHRAQRVANGKKVIISETGWPTAGKSCGAAEPSYDNALQYFINTYQWAEQDEVEIFYFSSFDEAWKTGDEGDVGAYWGLWDKDGELKYK